VVVKLKAGLLVAIAMLSAGYATNASAQALSPPPPGPCDSLPAFFLSSCQLTWAGVRLYGVVDMGVSYQTHGSPFDPNFPTGASYFLNKPSRQVEWLQAPNGMSQSLIGLSAKEPLGGGWSFVGTGELAFDPYSGLLANAPQALQDAIHVPLNAQEIPVDSSRWGWLAAQIFAGVSNPVWGTLTFGRQNSLLLDNVNAYDPMGGSYAFSPIGFSGLTCGAGDTEECRWTTAIKYRLNVGDWRFGVMGQPYTGTASFGAYNPNTGAVEGDIGGDIRFLGPGVLSVDLAGSWIADAVNIGPSGGATGSNPPGPPFPPTTFLAAQISNQTSVMATAKYSFGSWAPPIVTKGPVPPSGIPLTLYAGYEWIQFSNPSDPLTSFRDDGFLFNIVGSPATSFGSVASANGTAINNNAFDAACGTGSGCSDKIFQVMWVGAKYGITRDLDVIGAYYHYIQNQFALGTSGGLPVCANTGAHGSCAGTEDMASAVIDWRFLPKWDVYLGTFFSQVNGGLANGYLARNNLATTGGVRFRF
jgi:predicted porin